MTDERITELEVQLAQQMRVVDELNEVVATQAQEIAVLTRRMRMVMQRLAENDLVTGASVPLSDQKPPHY